MVTALPLPIASKKSLKENFLRKAQIIGFSKCIKLAGPIFFFNQLKEIQEKLKSSEIPEFKRRR